MFRQQTRRGTQNLVEIDTLEMLDKLKPEAGRPCRKGTKPVGRTCCRSDKMIAVSFDERIGVALSRARNFVAGRHQREAEVKQAADEVLLAARKSEGGAK